MSRFSDYLQKTFHFSAPEAEEVIAAMKKPLGKSIRVNTRKIPLEDFKIHAREQGWTLTNTDIPEVFLIDRDDTTIALGNTIEHMAGWFYIQEVAAAMPPHLLRRESENSKQTTENTEDTINTSNLNLSPFAFRLILDMCAAPGGKTTQLADYFPESLVIANEVNRTRTPQLFDNLDRMGYDNIAVVSCDGRFFQNFPDFFDAVLLDAPCSGEGTAFRDAAVIDHWNEKNIDRIAKLQKQLFATAEAIVKPGGRVSYSTCTLNKEENERVIESTNYKLQTTLIEEKKKSKIEHGRLNIEDGSFEKNTSYIDLVFSKRFWPHIEHTGGFFASIFQKRYLNSAPLSRGDVGKTDGFHTSKNPPIEIGITPPLVRGAPHQYPVLAAQGQKNLIVKPATKGEWEIVERFVSKHLKTKLRDGFLYLSKDGVYFNQRNLGPLAEHFYFVHAGARIGSIKGNIFTPTHHLGWCVADTSAIPTLEVTSALWSEILSQKIAKISQEDGYYLGRYGRGTVGILRVESGGLRGV